MTKITIQHLTFGFAGTAPLFEHVDLNLDTTWKLGLVGRNGPVEGVNRKLKQIKRTAYGYRNWTNFHYRIQIEFNIRVQKRGPIRK